MSTKQLTGLELASALVEEHSNEFGGSEPVEKIASSRFAVVVERSDDAWVLSANDWQEVAAIALVCATPEYEVEWISAVYDVATGEAQEYTERLEVTITDPDGNRWSSSTGSQT